MKTRLDLLLDRVEAGNREVTIDTDGLSRDQVDQIMATARGRGLSVSRDRRFVLVRDLSKMHEVPTMVPGTRRGR